MGLFAKLVKVTAWGQIQQASCMGHAANQCISISLLKSFFVIVRLTPLWEEICSVLSYEGMESDRGVVA